MWLCGKHRFAPHYEGRLIPLQPEESRIVGSVSKCAVDNVFVLMRKVMLINRQPESKRQLLSFCLPAIPGTSR